MRGPAFTASWYDGGKVSSRNLHDKPTVLVFWASWCGPCVQEIPSINDLAEKLGKTVNIVAINSGEDVATVRRAVDRYRIRYPVAMDPDGRIRESWQVEGIPTVVILDRHWIVRYRGNGLPLRVTSMIRGLEE